MNETDNAYMDDKRGLYVQDDVVISDKDKMVGKEHEDAIRSPMKGSGIHITIKLHSDMKNYRTGSATSPHHHSQLHQPNVKIHILVLRL